MDQREELLELLLADEAGLDDLLEEKLPLSFAQQRLWFLNQLSEGTDASYNVPFALRLRGRLDLAAIEKALNAVVARHDVLRASFDVKDDKPIQIISNAVPISISVMEPAPHQIASEIAAHARHVFDLSCAPLLKITLLKIDEADHILLLNLHHIVADGWSIGILVRELSELYGKIVSGQHGVLPEPIFQYANYAEWQRAELGNGAMKTQLAYWMRQLDGCPNFLSLPADRPRPVRMTGCGAQVRFVVPLDLRDALVALSALEGVTLFMTLMAAFMVLLHRATGQGDIAVGTPIAGRGRPEFENIIGCFVNTVVLRGRINKGDSFASLLRHVKAAALEAYENQDLPFEVLVEHLRPERNLSHTPVFQVMLALQNIPIGNLLLPGLTVEPFAQDLSTAKFDLNLNLSERATGISAILEYNSDIFDAETIDKFARSFLALLRDIAGGASNRRIAEFDLSEIDEIVAVAASPAAREEVRAAAGFWRQILGDLSRIEVPRCMPPIAAHASARGTRVRLVKVLDIDGRLRELARRRGATVHHVLLAAFAVLQVRLTRGVDLVIGVHLDELIGSEDETAGLWSVMRLALGGDPSFDECIDRVKHAEREARKFALSLEGLSAYYRTEVEAPAPIFPVSFSLDGSQPRADSIRRMSALHLAIASTRDGFEVALHFDKLDNAPSDVSRLLEIYEQLLGDVSRHSDRPISQMRLVPEEERERIIHGLNPDRIETVTEKSLSQPFEECAGRMPDAVALVEGRRRFSYRELDHASSRLAHYLRARGLREGGRVAILMYRSANMVIGLYGVSKVGAAYIPVDPELPPDRISLMLNQAEVDFVLVRSNCRAAIPPGEWVVIDIDAIEGDLRLEPTDRMELSQPSSGVAYLMYTSGSTGVAKAVQFPIDAAMVSLRWLQRRYPVRKGDHHLFKTPFTFDVSIWEIFWPLHYGGTLVICDSDGHLDPAYLRDLIEEHQVTAVNFVPSMLQVFLRELPRGSCASLRWMFCGGEALTPVLRDLCYEKLPETTLLNLCGPTETHSVADTTVDNEPGRAFIPLGRPSAAFRLYILDEHLEPLPIGVPGELYIGGDVGLAHGYCGQPTLTADRFLPDPFGSPGARMYRSGDICRYFENGVLEHLGRADRQIKIRGVRIELPEIESVLTAYEGVSASITIAVGEGPDCRLVAFVVPESSRVLDLDAIAQYAAGALPRQMIPWSILSVAEIPTTPNGKVDIAALTGIWREHHRANVADGVSDVPQNAVEERLKKIFQEVLNQHDIHLAKSFFDIGGHSLLALQLVAACRREFGVFLPTRVVYTNGSVRALAAEIETIGNDQGQSLIPFSPQDRDDDDVVLLIHGASGMVAPFRHLAKQLETDFTVFGLQAPGLVGECDIRRSVEAYAEFYVALAERVRRGRPIVLIGWSFGGTIAVEMARLWGERGTVPIATLLLDSFVLSPPEERPGGFDGLGETVDALNGFDYLGPEFSEIENSHPGELGSRVRTVLASNLESFTRFVPEKLDVSVDLLRAAGGWPGLAGSLLSDYGSEYRGWNRFIEAVVAHDIDGDHFTLLSKPYSQCLAARVLEITGNRRPR